MAPPAKRVRGFVHAERASSQSIESSNCGDAVFGSHSGVGGLARSRTVSSSHEGTASPASGFMRMAASVWARSLRLTCRCAIYPGTERSTRLLEPHLATTTHQNRGCSESRGGMMRTRAPLVVTLIRNARSSRSCASIVAIEVVSVMVAHPQSFACFGIAGLAPAPTLLHADTVSGRTDGLTTKHRTAGVIDERNHLPRCEPEFSPDTPA